MKLLIFLLAIYWLVIPLYAGSTSDISQISTLPDVTVPTHIKHLKAKPDLILRRPKKRPSKDGMSNNGKFDCHKNKKNIYYARKYLDVIKNTPNDVSEQFMEKEEKLVEKQLTELMVIVEKIREEAMTKGFNISECIDANLDAMNDFTKEAIVTLKYCAQNKAREIEDQIIEKRDDFNELSLQISNILKDVENCEQEIDKIKTFCYSLVENKIDMISPSIDEKVKLIISQVQEMILNFKSNFLQLCTNNVNVGIKGETMLEDVLSCVKIKFPNINVKLSRSVAGISSRNSYIILIIVNIIFLFLTVSK